MPSREDIPQNKLSKEQRKTKRKERVRGRRGRFAEDRLDLDALVSEAHEKSRRLESEKRPLLPEFIDKPVMIFNPEEEDVAARIAPGEITRSVNGQPVKFPVYDMDTVILPDISSTNALVQQHRASDAAQGAEKKEFFEKQKKISEAMEGMLFELAQDVFGPDAEIIMPALHGDIKEGTDLMVVYRDEEGRVMDMLAMDITFAGAWEIHEKKASRSLRGVISGGKSRKGNYVSYVRIPKKKDDASEGYMYVTARNVPRVVLPIGKVTVLKMLSKWVKGQDFDFKNKPLHKGLLEVIEKQLEAQIDAYVRVKGGSADEPKALNRLMQRLNALRQSLDTYTRHDIPMRRQQAFSVGNTRTRTLKAAQDQLQRIQQIRKEGDADQGYPGQQNTPPPLRHPLRSFADVSRAINTNELPRSTFERELLFLEDQGRVHVTKTVHVPAVSLVGEDMSPTELWEITNMEDRAQRVLYDPVSYKTREPQSGEGARSNSRGSEALLDDEPTSNSGMRGGNEKTKDVVSEDFNELLAQWDSFATQDAEEPNSAHEISELLAQWDSLGTSHATPDTARAEDIDNLLSAWKQLANES